MTARDPRPPSVFSEPCVFCAVAHGRAPTAMVHHTTEWSAFLDTRPLYPGHVLVIPHGHIGTLMDLPAEAVGPFFLAVQRIAAAVEKAMQADGVFVAVNNRVSQSVPHLHVHVVPRRKGDRLRGFFWPRTSYVSEAEKQQIAQAIARELAESLG